MGWVHDALARLRGELSGSAVESEVEEEVAFHLAMRAREYEAAGLDPESARRKAAQRFGDRDRVERACVRIDEGRVRDRRRLQWAERMRQDLGYAIRMLRRSPGFALAALVTLSLGIGGTTAVFSVVHGVLLEPLPFEEPEELVFLWQNDLARGSESEAFSGPDFVDVRAATESFDHLVAQLKTDWTLTGAGEPQRVLARRVTPGWFGMLGVEPVLGRGFAEEESASGRDRVVVVSEGLWRSRLGGRADVLGETVILDQRPYTVVGVAPERAELPGLDADVWAPLAIADFDIRGQHSLAVVGRLADGVSLESVQPELARIMAGLAEAYPEDNTGRSAYAEPVLATVVGDLATPLYLLLGAVALVLLIACANVANLLLARGVTREREMAVRTTLGAPRRRLVGQLLTESMVLAVLGGVLGVGLAAAGVHGLLGIAPPDTPRLDEVGLSPAVLGFALLATLATAALFGLFPALRTAARDPGDALREGGRSGASRKRQRARNGLVVVEVALTTVLAVGAGLLIRSLGELQRVDPGFDAERLATLDFQLPAGKYEFPEGWPWFGWPAAERLFDGIEEAVARVPGVERVTVAMNGPEDEGWTTRTRAVPGPPIPTGELEEAYYRPVNPGYFRTTGIPLLRGRAFDGFDVGDAPKVAIVNEAYHRRYFPDGDAIGKQISIFGVPREVVGVVPDTRFRGLEAEARPAMYVPFRQGLNAVGTVVVRVEGDPVSVLPAVRDAIWRVDPDLALFDVGPVRDVFATSAATRRFVTTLLGVFAAIALVLSLVGIYGVLAYSVAERTREMGLRMAMGALPADVRRMVVRQGMGVVVLALLIGLAGAAATARLARNQLFGVGPLDLTTFAVVVTSLLVVALVACLVPAWRATRVDPLEALRYE